MSGDDIPTVPPKSVPFKATTIPRKRFTPRQLLNAVRDNDVAAVHAVFAEALIDPTSPAAAPSSSAHQDPTCPALSSEKAKSSKTATQPSSPLIDDLPYCSMHNEAARVARSYVHDPRLPLHASWSLTQLAMNLITTEGDANAKSLWRVDLNFLLAPLPPKCFEKAINYVLQFRYSTTGSSRQLQRFPRVFTEFLLMVRAPPCCYRLLRPLRGESGSATVSCTCFPADLPERQAEELSAVMHVHVGTAAEKCCGRLDYVSPLFEAIMSRGFGIENPALYTESLQNPDWVMWHVDIGEEGADRPTYDTGRLALDTLNFAQPELASPKTTQSLSDVTGDDSSTSSPASALTKLKEIHNTVFEMGVTEKRTNASLLLGVLLSIGYSPAHQFVKHVVEFPTMLTLPQVANAILFGLDLCGSDLAAHGHGCLDAPRGTIAAGSAECYVPDDFNGFLDEHDDDDGEAADGDAAMMWNEKKSDDEEDASGIDRTCGWDCFGNREAMLVDLLERRQDIVKTFYKPDRSGEKKTDEKESDGATEEEDDSSTKPPEPTRRAVVEPPVFKQGRYAASVLLHHLFPNEVVAQVVPYLPIPGELTGPRFVPIDFLRLRGLRTLEPNTVRLAVPATRAAVGEHIAENEAPLMIKDSAEVR